MLGAERAELDAIARAGSGNARGAFFVGDEDELANALATIVGGSIIFEQCNGLDDDCDTRIDEDFPDLGNPCNDGDPGECLGTGERVCNAAGDGTRCNITDAGAMPGMEVCNGDDDDCDGLVDESLSCIPACTPSGPEVCDGIDNDCNGVIDETDPAIGTPCGTTDEGVCERGVNRCIGGTIVCVGAIEPRDEICNGLDDDCDGDGDDMAPCPGDTSCIDGGCRIRCIEGEFPCPPGFSCAEDDTGRFCVPDPCLNCRAAETCINDVCVDLCEDVTCDVNETCRRGDCLDCNATGCAPDQVCAGGACVSDPCVNVSCGARESCVGGDCVADCDDELCPTGQSCDADGRCADDACAGIDCGSDTQVCLDGACVSDPCLQVRCAPGEVCVGAGQCVDDPCRLATCRSGRHCEAGDDGGARCVSDTPPDPPYRVYAGGSGCGCRTGAPPGGGAWLLLAFAALALRRRR